MDPFFILQVCEAITHETCRTTGDRNCVSGPYAVVERIQFQNIHFQNCIPFPINQADGQIKPIKDTTGRTNNDFYELYDVNNLSGAQGVDFDWFCPVELISNIAGEYHQGINLNPKPGAARVDFRDQLRRCANVNVNSRCASTKTLEQICSVSLSPGKHKIHILM